MEHKMIKVCSSTIINIPLADVWHKIKDFNGLPNWHPAVAASQIEATHAEGAVGCIRNFSLADGSGNIRETLLAISDHKHTLTYNMLLNDTLPFVDYVSTITLEEITDRNQTFAKWTAQFTVSDDQAEYWQKFVEVDVFLGGFSALEDSFL